MSAKRKWEQPAPDEVRALRKQMATWVLSELMHDRQRILVTLYPVDPDAGAAWDVGSLLAVEHVDDVSDAALTDFVAYMKDKELDDYCREPEPDDDWFLDMCEEMGLDEDEAAAEFAAMVDAGALDAALAARLLAVGVAVEQLKEALEARYGPADDPAAGTGAGAGAGTGTGTGTGTTTTTATDPDAGPGPDTNPFHGDRALTWLHGLVYQLMRLEVLSRDGAAAAEAMDGLIRAEFREYPPCRSMFREYPPCRTIFAAVVKAAVARAAGAN
jgi:hypothetical protein